MKKPLVKLALRKETVRTLAERDLGRVAGGSDRTTNGSDVQTCGSTVNVMAQATLG
jgi:hypothetical protein